MLLNKTKTDCYLKSGYIMIYNTKCIIIQHVRNGFK